MLEVAVKVQPSSSKKRITVTGEGIVKVYLCSAPENNKANKELIKYLAGELGVTKSNISITRGLKNRAKTLQIAGISAEDFKKMLFRHTGF
ncbi:MAG: DUF167 domain-containing protein [Elusimicrobiota bacterium]